MRSSVSALGSPQEESANASPVISAAFPFVIRYPPSKTRQYSDISRNVESNMNEFLTTNLSREHYETSGPAARHQKSKANFPVPIGPNKWLAASGLIPTLGARAAQRL